MLTAATKIDGRSNTLAEKVLCLAGGSATETMVTVPPAAQREDLGDLEGTVANSKPSFGSKDWDRAIMELATTNPVQPAAKPKFG
jgi:hypothetical protein